MFLLFSFPLTFLADNEIMDAELMFFPLERLLIFGNRFHLVFCVILGRWWHQEA